LITAIDHPSVVALSIMVNGKAIKHGRLRLASKTVHGNPNTLPVRAYTSTKAYNIASRRLIVMLRLNGTHQRQEIVGFQSVNDTCGGTLIMVTSGPSREVAM
jgi:hypothetical protein